MLISIQSAGQEMSLPNASHGSINLLPATLSAKFGIAEECAQGFKPSSLSIVCEKQVDQWPRG
jgi:hypothetical protein